MQHEQQVTRNNEQCVLRDKSIRQIENERHSRIQRTFAHLLNDPTLTNIQAYYYYNVNAYRTDILQTFKELTR